MRQHSLSLHAKHGAFISRKITHRMQRMCRERVDVADARPSLRWYCEGTLFDFGGIHPQVESWHHGNNSLLVICFFLCLHCSENTVRIDCYDKKHWFEFVEDEDLQTFVDDLRRRDVDITGKRRGDGSVYFHCSDFDQNLASGSNVSVSPVLYMGLAK